MRDLVRAAAVAVIPVIALPLTVGAQVAPPPPITPQQLEQLTPPDLPRLAPSLRPVAPDVQRGPGEGQLVSVGAVRVAGNQSLPDSALLPLLQPLVGRDVPLSEIEDARIRLISAYGRAGFPFVTAVAGISREGVNVVTITIVEGRIGAVRLDGDIGPAGTQVLRFLNTLVGEAVSGSRLERALLLAGDIPGVTVRSIVRPLEGGVPGELELVAQVSRQAFSGYLSADNRGYRLTGPVQALLNVGANSFTEFGERVEAVIFQAQDWEQTFGQVGAEAFVGSSGLRLRAYAGRGISSPGGFLSQIGYEGTSTVFGVGAVYPIIRSRPANLFGVASFDGLNTEIELGNPSSPQSLDRVRTLRFGFEANALDSFVPFTPAPATTTASVRLHRGTGWFGATASGQAVPPGRVDSDFEFTKWSAELTRTQPVFAPSDGTMLSLFGLVAGQRTNEVLPQSEKFLFGGQRLGRGFYSGQVTGDTAIGVSVELQLDVRPEPFRVPWIGGERQANPTAQFYLFRDFGKTFENLATDRNRTLESYGGGVRLFLADGVQLDLEGVRRMTRSVDATAGSGVRPLPETAGFFRLLTRF